MSNEIWFTSDTHFGHKNILEYEKEARPFENLEAMNEALISNWNNTVRPKDTVYHLGDFAFGVSNIGIASRLNGRKKLVMGNHDTYSCDLYLAHFERLFGVYYWRRCVLTHIPIHPDNLGSRAFLNIHGHLHSKNMGKWINNFTFVNHKNYFNVSVEQHNLTPVNSSVIMERLKEIE